MVTACPSITRPARRAIWLFVAALLAPALAPAQEANDPGRAFAVPAPITPEPAARLRKTIGSAVKIADVQRGQRVFKVILDFNSDNRPNGSTDFGACLELADFLRSLQNQGVRTIGYVHGDVTRHSVLPVLACSEVVFSKGATLGDVVRDPGETLDAVKRLAYDEAVRNRLPLAVIRKMYDRDLVVVRVADGAGDRYQDARTAKAGEPVLLAGTTVRCTFEQARAFGLCQPDARENLDEVAAAYNLAKDSVLMDPMLDQTRLTWLIAVDGPVNPELKERLKRRVRRARGDGASLIVFVLRCHGGDSESAADIADFLENLNKDPGNNKGRPFHPVRTVAYVTEESSDAAAFLALACHRIVMQPKAKLGDFERFLQVNRDREEVVRRNLEDLAKRRGYPPLLARALADRDMQLFQVMPARGPGGPLFVSKQELDDDVKLAEPRWKAPREVKGNDGKYLILDAASAKEYNVASAVEDDLAGVYQLEDVEATQVHDATRERDWLDDLANFLRDPWTSVVLVMLGITCLILELKMPGVSLPGVIAAVCFVLFFWSHSQLNGQITWLALLLFVLGLLLIGLEVFVLPGLGVAGISGTVLVVGSLGLVAYGHWPRSNDEWVGFGRTIGPFGISILGALVAAFTLARFLPSIPFANRLMLKPTDEAVESSDDLPEPIATSSSPDFAALLGAVGVSATPLRPAGKVQFGDEFVDVVAEGGYVPPGTRVQVIEIEGMRIVVKEV